MPNADRLGRGVDRDTEERLVTENLPLVNYLVNEIASGLPGHVLRSDLSSAGMAALAEAARAFDASLGVPFAKYASYRIRGAILDELRSHDWASRSVRARARRRQQVEDALIAQLGHMPSAQEIADAMEVSVDDVRAAERDVHQSVVLSLEAFEYDGPSDDILPAAATTPEHDLVGRERIAYLHDAVDVLPERLRAVIRGLYFEERTISDLATELHVTESRISQIRSEALALLKDGLNSALAPELVPPVARPDGCVARRRASYFVAIEQHTPFAARLNETADPAVGVA